LSYLGLKGRGRKRGKGGKSVPARTSHALNYFCGVYVVRKEMGGGKDEREAAADSAEQQIQKENLDYRFSGRFVRGGEAEGGGGGKKKK